MKPYGCYNRPPFKKQYAAQSGYLGTTVTNNSVHVDRKPHYILIQNKMSQDCQYSKTTIDTRCKNCSWNQNEISNDVVSSAV